MLVSVAFTLAMSARATCEFGWSRPHGANRRYHSVAEPGHDFLAQFRVRTLQTNNLVNPGQRASASKLYGGLHFTLALLLLSA